ncbi:C2H2 type zinc finger domain-containing protein [Nannizzia gypsea CBS 118893]|uniref:C2H2 type zinc finger domain-containing protein n=1 Tax=Arthroderma gypseum (strain ATCC MYA-4604 / CBS 118893) TaxID=535722 RepID=E4UTJ9_ARTGP|nr:C2H2 type zinc finger domain-containing protein [Nannizzia gypsea CBS 118893]EFR00708.1 C2H2 type zinc finger domain-containing protein [Nannizzia gypsea CBS 118893]
MSKRSRDTSQEPPDAPSTSTPSTIPSSPPRHKYPHMDRSSEQPGPLNTLMHCTLPPHKGDLTFPTYEAYESHYLQTHINRCSECAKNFPSDLLLTRHIEENHDPVMEERKERGEKTFGCFVEGCERRCSTPQKRRRHLIDKHCFPKGYNFYIVNDGIDKYSSMLRSSVTMHRRRFSLETGGASSRGNGVISPGATPSRRRDHATYEDVKANDVSSVNGRVDVEEQDGLDGLTKSMSALRFVPHSVAARMSSKK